MLEVEFAQLSDAGRERENNEDYQGYAQREEPGASWLFALADGVGGHDDGEIASRAAVETVLSGFRAAAAGDMHPALLPRLVQAANAAVFEHGNTRPPARARMATTLVVCGLQYDSAVISHVGDSRCYAVRQGAAQLLTRDHTMANEQLRLGLVSAADARQSRMRQVLTRSLGQEMVANVDTVEYRLMPGDVLALCSDGLHNPVSAQEIAAALKDQPDLLRAAEALVQLANQKDGSDNITVQLVRVRDVERVGMYRGRPYKLR